VRSAAFIGIWQASSANRRHSVVAAPFPNEGPTLSIDAWAEMIRTVHASAGTSEAIDDQTIGS
jgi:hypothetical protein